MSRSSGHRFFEAIHGVYFDDLDAFGILHNARYLLYFERTIGAFWRLLGWGGSLQSENPDQYQLVRANHIEYLRPVSKMGEVRVRVWVEKLGHTSLTFGCVVMPMDQDVDCATGERVVVKIDPKTRRPTEWSDGFRALIAPYIRTEG
ncbi:MAG: acyl-CoA thioesterase [Myxococcaceae bacterium]